MNTTKLTDEEFSVLLKQLHAEVDAEKAAKQTGEGNTPRISVLLSSGRTVAHERMSNGAQNAYIVGSESGAMTESEWTEYVSLIKGV